MKVLLVGINSKFIHSNLAIRYLEAYTRDLSYICKIREFSVNDRVERVLEEIMIEKPNVVAFSCYIWNMKYIEELSTLIKLIDDKIEIIYGGPEVSYNSVEFLKNNIGDYVVEGEGEDTYREFIIDKLEGKSLSKVKGLYSRDGNDISYGGTRNFLDMDQLIFPYSEHDDLENKIIYYEASRGCPFKCKYCLSSTTHGVRMLSIERVKSDLSYFIKKKVRLVKFVDRTFNCNNSYTMSIWNFLMEQDTETSFHFEISANLLKDNELELLKRAPKGRFQFEVGVQTTNDEILRNINRNIKFKDIEDRVLKVKALGNIKQHLDLIAGLPGENFTSFVNSFNEVFRLQPEEIQLGFLKLLKGSTMREEAESWGMAYSPYAPYEILKTSHVSYEELIELKRVEAMVDKYYNSQKFSTTLKYLLQYYKSPFEFFYSLGMFFYEKDYFSRNISSADYYYVFIEFMEEKLMLESKILKEIVKYDYLRFNKKQWLADFLNRYTDKEADRKIKEYIKRNKNEFLGESFHMEIFDIDVLKYSYENQIKSGNYFYVVFDEKNSDNIIDVTDIVNL